MPSVGEVSISLVLDRSRFNRDIQELKQLKIDSFPIEITADTRKFQQDVARLKRETHGCLDLPICLDDKRFNQQLRQWRSQNKGQIDVGVQLDTRSVERQLQGLQNAPLRPITLTAQVDTTLARQQILDLRQQLSGLQSMGQISIQGVIAPTRSQDGPVLNLDKALNSFFDRLRLEQHFKSLEKTIEDTSARRGVFGTIASGAGFQLGGFVGNQINRQLKRQLGIDFRDLGLVNKAVQGAAVPVKLITENEQLKQAMDQAGDVLGSRLRKVAYGVGDGIVAGLEADAGRINAFMKESFKTESFKHGLSDAKQEAKQIADLVKDAVIEGSRLSGIFEPLGERLASYRKRAIAERAVPLVEQRASEILTSKRVKDTANVVTPQTKELFIATGGYGMARGLSGKRIAQDLKQDVSEEAEVIWVRNLDTDIKKTTTSAGKLREILTSLSKPNLRGYSKDAVEIAAQAMAAYERNPEIKIKILGESGGGFPAEEAAEILRQIGIKNVEFLGVGTPDFAGRVGQPGAGQKIISTDESLGAEAAKLYGRLGLADLSSPQQNLLGVRTHPFEGYRQAKVAELETFVKGPPQPLTADEITQVTQAADAFSALNLEEMDPRQTAEIADLAFKNLQTLRAQLRVATDDTREDIEKLVRLFEGLYVRTSEEPADYGEIRRVLRRAATIFDQLHEVGIVEARGVARQMANELKQYQAEFKSKRGREVGTLGAKFKGLDTEMTATISQLLSPIDHLQAIFEQRRWQDVVDVLGDIEPPTGGALAVAGEKVGNLVTKLVQLAGDKAEQVVVARINQMLSQVPGQPGTLEANPRQITSLSELEPEDYQRLSALGMYDLFGAGKIAGRAGAATLGPAFKGAGAGMQAIEDLVLSAVPGGKLAKGAIQKIGVPALGFYAATQLPGGAAAAEGLSNLIGTGVNPLTHGAGDALFELLKAPLPELPAQATGLSSSVINAARQAMYQMQLTTVEAFNANLVNVIRSVASATGSSISEVLTVLTGGGLVVGGSKEVIKKALSPIKESLALPASKLEQTLDPALKDLETTSRQLGSALEARTQDAVTQIAQTARQFDSSRAKIQRLKGVNPQRAGIYAETTLENVDRALAEADAAIGQLPPAQRMASREGAQMANIKSRLTRARNAAQGFVEGVSRMVEDPMAEMERNVKGMTIDVQVETVPFDALSPDLASIQTLARDRLKDLGQVFSKKGKELSLEGGSTEVAKRIATEILVNADVARAEIDRLLQSLGRNATQDLKDIVKSTRKRITEATKKAGAVEVDAGEVGIYTARGMAGGIAQQVNALRDAGRMMGRATREGAEDELGISSPSRVFIWIGQQVVKGLELGVKGAKGVIEQVQRDIYQVREHQPPTGDLPNQTRQVAQDINQNLGSGSTGYIDRTKQKLKELGEQFPALNRFKGLLGDIAFSALALFGAFSAGDIIVNTFQSAYQSAKRYQALQVGLQAASGSAAEGAKNFQFVREEAQRLSLPLEVAGKNFKGLQAAARGTPLESQAKNIFTAVGEASTALQLSPEETDRAFTALTQIASKGTVSAEELRQQLAEAIPGAFQIAARAMGVTEAELNRLLETGSIMSSDFLPKFARQLHTELSGGLNAASKSAQATENRLANANLLLQQSFNQMALPTIAAGMQTLASAMQFAAQQASTLGKVGLAVLIAGGLRLAPIIWGLAVKAFPVLSQGIMSIGFALGVTMRSLALFSVQLAAMMVAVEAASLLVTYLQDQGGAAREAANEMKRLNDEYERHRAQREGLPPAPEERQPLNWVDSYTTFLRQRYKKNFSELFPWLKDAPDTVTPFADNAAKDQVRASEEMIKQAMAARDRVNQTLNSASLAQSLDALPLGRLGGFKEDLILQNPDKEAQDLRELASVRASITAKEAERGKIIGGRDMIQLTKEQKVAVAELDKQIQGLLTRQDRLLKGPQKESDILSSALETAKKRLAALDTPEGRGSMVAEQVEKEKQAWRKLIPELEATKKASDAVLLTDDPKVKLQKRFKDANDAQAVGLSNLGSMDARNKAAIAEGFAKGKYSERDYQLLEADREKQSADAALETNQKTLKDLRAIKESPAFSRLAPGIQTQVNKGVIDTEKAVSEARSQAAQATVALKKQQNQQILEDLERANRQADAAIKASENERIGRIKRMQAAGILSEQESSTKIAQIQQASTTKEIQQTQARLAQVKQLRKQGALSAEEAADKEIDLNTQLSDLKLQQIDQELQARQALNQRILEGVELAYQRTEAAIAQTRSAKETQIRRQQLTGALTEEEAGTRIAQAQVKQTEQEINLTKSKLKKVDELEKQGLKTRNEATKERLQLQQQLGQQTLQLANDELAKQQALIKGDEARIEKAKTLLQARDDLAKALNELEQVKLEANISPLDRVLNIYKDLQDLQSENQSEGSRKAQERMQKNARRYLLRREFQTLGVDPDRRGVDILKQKIQLENELAANKRAALQKEQQLQLMLLILEQKKNKLTSERGLLDARAALAKAKASGDPTQVALAQQGVKLARERLTLEDSLGKVAIAALGTRQEAEQIKYGMEEQNRRTQQGEAAAQVVGLRGQGLFDVGEKIFGQPNLGTNIPESMANTMKQAGSKLGDQVGNAILNVIEKVKSPDLKELGSKAGEKINQELLKLLKGIFGNLNNIVPGSLKSRLQQQQRPLTQAEKDAKAPRSVNQGEYSVVTREGMRDFWRDQLAKGSSIIYQGDTVESQTKKFQDSFYGFSAKEARQVAEQNFANYQAKEEQRKAFSAALTQSSPTKPILLDDQYVNQFNKATPLKNAPKAEDYTRQLLERGRTLQETGKIPPIKISQPMPQPPAPAPAPKSDGLSGAINRLEVAFAKSGEVQQTNTINNFFSADERGKSAQDNEKQILAMLGRVVQGAARQ